LIDLQEKREGSQNNVSCIITLPIHQRKGYGNLLIDFSYLLTRVEGRTGSPEKPFSDLGLVSYRNYWKLKLCYELRHQKDPITIGQLSQRTGMTTDDIICGLESLNALIRDPVTGYYALRLDYALFESLIENWEAKGYIKLNPKALVWTPYLMGRSQAEHLNDMPMSTIAPRSGELPKETKRDEKKAEDTADGTEEPADPNAMDIDAVPPADSALPTNGTLTKSIDPALVSEQPLSPVGPPSSQSSSSRKKHPQPFIASDILEQLCDIPPSRFEIVPAAPGTRGRQGGLRGAGRGRGRPRLDSPAVHGQEKDNYGATPMTEGRRGRGRPRLGETPRTMSAVSSAETPTGLGKGRVITKRIVTKAPRMRSLTAEASRPRSASTERSISAKGKGKNLATVVAAAATRTASASLASSVASSSSST
jgi:histone acetyltransferase SAS3